MPRTRLDAWMSAQSAHDVVIRGWLRNPKGRRNANSASVVALGEPTRYNTKTRHVFLGTAISPQTSLHQSMKTVKNFTQEKELAEIAIVLQNRI